MKKSLYCDLKYNPRVSEASEIVTRYWSRSEDVYSVETVSDAQQSQSLAWHQYLNLTAERILLRTTIMGLDVAPKLIQTLGLDDAVPFGTGTPALSKLRKTQMAMTFVPLTPQTADHDGRPVLARLYCVKGLPVSGVCPFSECGPSGADKYSWFLVDKDLRACRPDGRSWYLAAALLMAAFANKPEYRRRLAGFAVTGDLDDSGGRIRRVELGQKLDLVDTAGSLLRWMFPFENMRDVQEKDSNMKKSKFPKTLDEAKEIINAMQGAATRSLQASLKRDNPPEDADVSAWSEGLKCADVNAPGADGGADMNCLQLIRGKTETWILKAVGQLIKAARNKDIASPTVDLTSLACLLDRSKEARRSFLYYGAEPQMFFTLAKDGNELLIKELVKAGYDINARDGEGESALNFARDSKNEQAEKILMDNGGEWFMSDRMIKGYIRKIRTIDKQIGLREELVGHIRSGKLNVNRIINFDEAAPLRDDDYGLCATNESFEQCEPAIYRIDKSVSVMRSKTNFFCEALLFDSHVWDEKQPCLAKICMDSGKVDLQAAVHFEFTGGFVFKGDDIAKWPPYEFTREGFAYNSPLDLWTEVSQYSSKQQSEESHKMCNRILFGHDVS